MASIGERIEREVRSWPGVEERPHRFGGVAFRVNGHEIEHLHGGRWVDAAHGAQARQLRPRRPDGRLR